MWCFLTTLNGIEFRRIESISKEGGRHRNSKCRHEGLDRTGEPRTQSRGRGYSWKSSFFVIEGPRRGRERERKKRNRGGGYSWDLSDSPTRSLRSGGGRRNTLDAKMCKLRELIIPRVVRELVKSRSSMNVGGNSG